MEKVFTNVEHVRWIREQIAAKRPYWYGVYYLPCTEALLAKKAKQYPAHYKANRFARYSQDVKNNQIAGDCVNGAIKGAVWSELGARLPVYKSHDCPDKSADGMFEYCKKIGMPWGGMDSMPELPGIAVRFAGHVGIYLGNGEVGEWRGFAYGCVLTRLKGRKWTHWYQLPWTEYVGGDAAAEDKPAASAGALGSRLLVFGRRGEDVVLLQQALMRLGYPLPDWGADGDYGEETEKAVKDFQQDHGLEIDGDYGQLTHAELMAELAEQEAQNGDDDEAPAAPEKYVVVTGGSVYVRKGPGKEHDMITIVRRGARLEYVATADNGWHAVKASGIAGWISGKYTRIEEENDR